MMQLKQKIGELETDIADLTKDNERVNILYLQKKKEVEILKASHGELESGVNAELTQLRKENEQLRKSIAVCLFKKKEKTQNFFRKQEKIWKVKDLIKELMNLKLVS